MKRAGPATRFLVTLAPTSRGAPGAVVSGGSGVELDARARVGGEPAEVS